MGLTPLPPCTRATDHSVLDDSWNNSHKRWIPATVWAAQYAAHAAEQTMRSPQGLQRCAACAAEIAAAAKPVCSKCKMGRYTFVTRSVKELRFQHTSTFVGHLRLEGWWNKTCLLIVQN